MNDVLEFEARRLDRHFRDVLTELHTRPPRGLSPAARRARGAHIERLEAYRRRRRFPRNLHHLGRHVPIFIDGFGTRCAMGHLIEYAGGRDLVQHIASARNFDRVRELADIPELGAWLEANGLTVAEAARIQPSYCGTTAQQCVCSAATQGVVQGTLGDGGATLLVSAVYGPVVGVKAGDEVPLQDPWGLVSPGDVVFAIWNSGGTATASFVAPNGGTSVVVPDQVCWFPRYATIPGDVPYDVFTKALSASSAADCEAALVAHDATWGKLQGEPGCGDDAGTAGWGGASGTAGAGGSAGLGVAGVGATVGDAGTQVVAGADDEGGCTLSRSTHSGDAAFVLGAAVALLSAHALRRARRT